MSEENMRLYEEAQRRLRELTTLYEASQACLSISDQNALLAAIIEAAAQATDATLGSVMLIDEKKGEYVFGAHYGLSKETIVAVEAELHIPLGEGLVGAVITREQPMVVPDVTKDPRWIPMEETKESIRSFLGVPLIGREGRPLGALTLSRSDVGAFDEDHTRLLSTFANQAAMAIENARLYEQVQARSRYLETLQRINATLRSTLPLSEVLATIVRGAGEALNYVGSLIVIPDASGERLILGAVWGGRFLDAAVRLTGLELDAFSLPLTAENPMARAYLSGELQAWSRAPERIVVGLEPPISPKLAPVIERTMGAKLAVCIPLPAGKKVVGVLNVFSPRDQLSDEERAMLLGLANQAGLAIENARLYEQAQQEIIERKQVMEALRESEERYRRLVELSFDAIVIHREGKIVYINPAGAELLGASSPEELIGKAILDFVHPDYLEVVKARVVKTAEGKVAPLIEEKLLRLDGINVDVEIVRIPIAYQGQTAVQIVARDITQRKRAEEALRESEEKFRNLAEQSPNMIFINKKGRVVYANKKCEEIMGYKREELYSDDFDFLVLIAPESIDLVKANFNRHMKSEEVPPYEYALITKEGKRIEAIYATKLIRYEGENAILGTITDITERKQAEEALHESEKRYRRLFEDSPISLWEEDFSAVKTHLDRLRDEGVRDFRTYFENHPEAVVQCAKMVKVIDVNKATLELYQVESKDILQGDLTKALTPESYDAFREELVAIVEGKTSFESDTISEPVAGEKKYTILRWSVAPGHEETLSKVLVSITDITERKQAEEVLRESEETARVLLNAPTESAILIDTEGTILALSETAAQRLGKSVDELVGLCVYDIFSPDVAKSRKSQIDETIRSGEPVFFEDARMGILFDNSIYPVFDAQGKVAQVAVFARDITERKQAEEELRRLKEFNEGIVQSMTEGITVENAEGYFTLVNLTAATMLGYTPGELLGQHWTVVVPPDQQPIVQAADEQRARGEANRYEVELIRKDGTRVPVLISGSPRFEEGRFAGTLAVFTDITERKQAEEALRESEERYRALYEDNPSMYFTVDPGGTVLSVNQFGAKQLGYTVEELVGQSVLHVFHEDDKKAVLQQLTTCLQNPTQIAYWEFRKVHKDGSVLWVKETARTVRGADGKTVVLIVCEDITERKKLEERLRQAQKMDAIGQLAGGIAHDFNNLLTPIGGFAELLLWKTPEGSQQHEYLRQIKVAAERATALTRQLLTFARRDQVEVHALNLNEVAREVVGLLERTIDKAIAIEPYLADDLEVVEGDANQLHQVLLNLCLNARDAMPDGGRLIIETRNITLSEAKVRTDLDLKAGQYVLVSVTDTGIGMTAETQQHLFEPFFTTKTQGRGIGLAMTYGIVRRHGGTIHVYSEPDQGSTFKVYLPVARSPTEDTAPQEVKVVGGSETVLVVDDEEPVRRLLRRILEEGGYTVLLAADGVEAVELYTRLSTEIDLVVLDIIMPRMGGRKTYEQLREINPEVKVLLSSGYSANGRARDILAAGARGFLQKPYDLQAVLRTVRKALES